MANTANRGFASMDEGKQREIARKGGQCVPNEKHSFSKDPELASVGWPPCLGGNFASAI
jgi:uncharacterized protein